MIRDIDIIKAFKEGMSISELSKKYNYSRQGIYNILQRNNINYKKDKPEINIEDIKYDLKQKSINRIMKEKNISYHQMKNIMEKNNLQKKEIMSERLTEENIKRLYCEKGLDDMQIGKIFNCSPYTVRSFRWKHNIYNKNRNWKKELTKKKFLAMRKQYKTLTEISKISNLPYHIILKAKSLYEDNGNYKQ